MVDSSKVVWTQQDAVTWTSVAGRVEVTLFDKAHARLLNGRFVYPPIEYGTTWPSAEAAKRRLEEHYIRSQRARQSSPR